ncbi:hypothetical protein AB0O31_02545 [Kitasatospora cineracea]|uniref:hypothetical protein n=1 Tax=Kitasatospora cineracea TaxID=88074 RepID=UPI0034316045
MQHRFVSAFAGLVAALAALVVVSGTAGALSAGGPAAKPLAAAVGDDSGSWGWD